MLWWSILWKPTVRWSLGWKWNLGCKKFLRIILTRESRRMQTWAEAKLELQSKFDKSSTNPMESSGRRSFCPNCLMIAWYGPGLGMLTSLSNMIQAFQEGQDHRQSSSLYLGQTMKEVTAGSCLLTEDLSAGSTLFLNLGWCISVTITIFNRNTCIYSYVHTHTYTHKWVK